MSIRSRDKWRRKLIKTPGYLEYAIAGAGGVMLVIIYLTLGFLAFKIWGMPWLNDLIAYIGD